ncbi:MAG: BON domain-containing protein [Nitrospinae bacterium]|nr:BON domain-containing protein [Nitrospinota bacterium]
MLHRFTPFAVAIVMAIALPAHAQAEKEEKGTMERFGAAVDEKYEKTKEFFSDTAINARIKRRLLEDDQVSVKNISLTVDQGAVTVEGDAPSEEMAQRTLEIVRATEGVTGVTNKLQIIVREPSQAK